MGGRSLIYFVHILHCLQEKLLYVISIIVHCTVVNFGGLKLPTVGRNTLAHALSVTHLNCVGGT